MSPKPSGPITGDKEQMLRRFAANEMTDEDRAALGKIVTEAIGRRPRTNRRNPHYVKPSEAAAAWTHLYGTARAFVEWATTENIRLATAGLHEREDDQTANIKAVRDCIARLTVIAHHLDDHDS